MEPLDETVHMAQACDAAGFDVFWLAEAYPWWRKHSMEARSSTAATAIIARETKRIVIAWGIISPYTRHPVQIGMEARILQEAAGEGRFLLGLGASKIFMKEIGEGEKGREVGPATVMRESIEIIQGMLSGSEVNYEGKAFQAFLPALKSDARAPLAAADLHWRNRPGPATARWRHDRRPADRQHHHTEICRVFAPSHGGWREEGGPRRVTARSWLCGGW